MAPLLARPLAALATGLLLAGLVQAGPAAADAPTAALSVSVGAAGSTAGQRADDPFNLGPAPGSTTLAVRITNTGTEALRGLTAVTALVSNGAVGNPTCDLGSDEDPVLGPSSTVSCTFSISGVGAGSVHEDVTTVTATGVDSDSGASADAHFFATASEPPVRLGDRVWRDTDRDGVQDTGEPGLSGVRLTVTDPAKVVVDAQTTAIDGSYGFTLPALPTGSYTVAVDPASVGLTGLGPTTATSRLSTAGLAPGGSDLGLDFGFAVPVVTPPPPPPVKAAVRLTLDASPGTAIVGSTITVTGSIKRDGKAYKTSTVLERQVGGSSAWTKVKTVKSGSRGQLATTLKADRTADYRFRFAGNDQTASGSSGADRVVVRKATVKLTISAPGSVTKGGSIRVTGSIKREGKNYGATTVLQFSDDGDGWSTVKKVKSTSKGALSTSVKPSRTGEYRFRFAGNSTTDDGASKGDRVTVKPKPPAKPKPKTYANCAALNKVYPHGVGRSGATDKVRGSGDPVTDFTRDTKTYNKNTKSDRDRDGIACEKH